MPRPQFSIRTVLWLTLVVAAFLGGRFWEREAIKHKQRVTIQLSPNGQSVERIDFE